MTITLNHTVVPTSDNERAARRLADALDVPFTGFDGFDGKFATVRVSDTLRLLFMTVDEVAPQHLAFDVDGATFDRIRLRLERVGQPYGSSPWEADNGRTDHPLSARGLFWRDPDGHLFEVMTDTTTEVGPAPPVA
jgi:catechol 2,3-dioxygenase-like lactoylglutathione lyase family enzyme